MIRIRDGNARGHFSTDWLDSRHSFSFGSYQDPAHMGFRNLRVINQDIVQPGQGFPLHPHKDMEILSFVLEGSLEHRDDMGNSEIIHAGELQRMSAGSGIRHSEYNPSSTDIVHFLQIWILPSKTGITPGYELRRFSDLEEAGTLRLLADLQGTQGAARIHQDVAVYIGLLKQGQKLGYPLEPKRHGWVQLIRGELKINDRDLIAGDGAAISDETEVRMEGIQEAEFILFDLN